MYLRTCTARKKHENIDGLINLVLEVYVELKMELWSLVGPLRTSMLDP